MLDGEKSAENKFDCNLLLNFLRGQFSLHRSGLGSKLRVNNEDPPFSLKVEKDTVSEM